MLDRTTGENPDWIQAFSEEVWNGGGPASTARIWYSPHVVLRTPAGLSIGAATARRSALETRHMFPDREMLDEDVIRHDTAGGDFFASQRVLFKATHRRGGALGPASGLRVRYRCIADCFVADDQICDVWQIRDTGGLLRQIGRDPRSWVSDQIAQGGICEALTPETDRAGPYDGQGSDDAIGAGLADLLARMMEAEFSAIPAEYDPACALSYPGAVEAEGRAEADRFWLPLRAAFPAAVFVIHHVVGREEPQMAPRAAVRWSLTGRHDGWGVFGAPSGAHVHVMGITHAEFGPRGVRREWTLYDQASVWSQILGANG